MRAERIWLSHPLTAKTGAAWFRNFHNATRWRRVMREAAFRSGLWVPWIPWLDLAESDPMGEQSREDPEFENRALELALSGLRVADRVVVVVGSSGITNGCRREKEEAESLGLPVVILSPGHLTIFESKAFDLDEVFR